MANKKYIGIIKKGLIGLLVIFIVIQFIHPAKNINSTVTADDITTLYPVSDSVHIVLQKACYDCHSNNTSYPWYNNLQPVAWWLNDHVTGGKKELNFSEFGKLTPPRQARKLKKLAHEVEDGDMPLNSYTWIHKDAILTDQEKKMIIGWATTLSKQISAKWIADSLKKG
jgi:hypothetical protein